MGMIMWQLLTIIYFIAGSELHGFNWGHFINVFLQTVYIYKFFRWETGYFNTLDITLDRAGNSFLCDRFSWYHQIIWFLGYYICWGCLVWVPSFYTFHSYFFVYHQPSLGMLVNFLILLCGLLSIWYNYDVDRQKEIFRTSGGKSMLVFYSLVPCKYNFN